MTDAVRVRVPAKVNLRLGVGPRRPDGYHELVTVFHAVALYDEVAVRASDRLALAISGTGAGELPTDRGNLAWRAAELLAAEAGVRPEVQIELRKSIPVAGRGRELVEQPDGVEHGDQLVVAVRAARPHAEAEVHLRRDADADGTGPGVWH